MLKKFAEWILREDIKYLRSDLESSRNLNRILRETFEEVKDEAEKALTPKKNYNITPEKLTVEDQQIIGKFVDTQILDLLSKWFKAQADNNNDYLVHSAAKSPEEQAVWRAAILVYEDWYNFLAHCKAIFNRSENALHKSGKK